MNEPGPPDEPPSGPGDRTPDEGESADKRALADGAAPNWQSEEASNEQTTTAGDSLGESAGPTDGDSQVWTALRAAGFGWLGFGFIIFWQLPVGLVALPIATEWLSTVVAENVLSTVSLGFGTATGVWIYLRWSNQTIDFLDVSVPSLDDLAYIVGGVTGLFAALIGISELLSQLGISSSEHAIVQQSQQNPELLLFMIPLSIFVVGPGEELLYRNVVQKSLYESFSKTGAIVVASVIFASVHILAYAGSTPTSVLTSLGLIFFLSLVLGWIYARQENVVVPAIVHGLFNAGQFLILYFEPFS